MTPFAHYMLHVAMPHQLFLRQQNAHNLRGRCEVCDRPVKKGTRWCHECRVLTKPCDNCNDLFTTERGARERQFCSLECSGEARHKPKKTPNHKPGMRMRSWARNSPT